MHFGFRIGFRPRCEERETALWQIERLGFRAADVRDIVVTHLDLDHAGGLPDFPAARVHVLGDELDAALERRTLNERQRYWPELWRHSPSWVRHAPTGERWHGFDSVRALAGDEILLVPLYGHTRGHAGVAVRADDGWLLHCGDAYFFHGEVQSAWRCPPGLMLFQAAINVDFKARVGNQARLRRLRREHDGDLRLFCAHDPVEFAHLARGTSPRRRVQ
jgi:glyoxylase-like metal-dependent hydrolase (beta-lactamase superfamily II)